MNTQDYRIAPGGEGPHATTWQDKPHRLVYDLCAEIEKRDQLSHKLEIVTVTNNPEEYPKNAEASAKYPHLVEYVEDEAATFIVDPESGYFCRAHDFFYMHSITAIAVDPKEMGRSIGQ